MTKRQTALVTGVGGQDGTLLTRQLSAMGWLVTGVTGADVSGPHVKELAELPGVTLESADLSDIAESRRLVADVAPDAVFHLAAISSVAESWKSPVQTAQINAMASTALMAEALELSSRSQRTVRFVNASSGEIFAGAGVVPQSEDTPISPVSPYGATKAFAHMMGTALRTRGLHLSNAILYNHESPLRPTSFVTRKITSSAAAIASGTQDKLSLGNLDARRDWGWAPDYADCMIRMAMHDRPDDFVVATGVAHSVRDFVVAAFHAAGIDDWERYVEYDAQFARPADSMELVGDASKARRELGWQPTKTFEEVVAALVESDLAAARHRDGASHVERGAS